VGLAASEPVVGAPISSVAANQQSFAQPALVAREILGATVRGSFCHPSVDDAGAVSG
jgi:hypothetical protein